MEDIADIFEECGLDDDCFSEKLTDLYYNLTPENLKELEEFASSPECEDECIDIFKDVIKDDSVTEDYCINDICNGGSSRD